MSRRTAIMEKFKRESFFLEQISTKSRVQMFYVLLTNFTLLFCVIFQNLYLILIISRFIKHGGLVWEMLSRFLTCLGLALSLNYGSFKHKTVIKINLEMRSVFETIMREKLPLKKFPDACSLINIGILYILISEIIVSLSFVSWPGKARKLRDRDIWVEAICATGVCDYSTLSESNKDNWFFVDLFLYTLATVASGVFLSTVYGYYCLGIISFFKSTLAALKRQGEADLEAPLTREFVLKCREYCQAIKNVLRLCNNVFSGMFVIWFGVSLICTCDYLSRTMKNTDNHDPLQIALYFFVYGQAFISVIIVSFVSTKLPNIFNKALVDMQSLTLNRKQVSLDVFAELNILLVQIQSYPIGIEIGGCFLITKAFFVSYLGTIITFLMIMYQLESKYKQLSLV